MGFVACFTDVHSLPVYVLRLNSQKPPLDETDIAVLTNYAMIKDFYADDISGFFQAAGDRYIFAAR